MDKQMKKKATEAIAQGNAEGQQDKATTLSRISPPSKKLSPAIIAEDVPLAKKLKQATAQGNTKDQQDNVPNPNTMKSEADAKPVQRQAPAAKAQGKGKKGGKGMQLENEKQPQRKANQKQKGPSKAARHPEAAAVIDGLRSRRQSSSPKGQTAGNDATPPPKKALDDDLDHDGHDGAETGRHRILRALQYFILKRAEGVSCKDRITEWQNMPAQEKAMFTINTKKQRGL